MNFTVFDSAKERIPRGWATTTTNFFYRKKMAAARASLKVRTLSLRQLLGIRQFHIDAQLMRNKTALERREERKMRQKLYIVKKKPTKSDKVNATNTVSSIDFAEDKEIAELSEKLTLTNLARSQIRQSSAVVDPGSVYQTSPSTKPTVIGEPLKPRFIWSENDWPNGFPNTPEEANADITTYLIQKDIFRRRQVLEIPNFCVGSIIAVTRAEPYSPKGSLRFVGICILKLVPESLLHSRFTLRNVIDNEPIEINFELYSPLIQKIEVLKHERRTDMNGKEDLTFLRDYPIEDSMVDENMEALPYTEEPTQFVPQPGDRKRLTMWFKEKFREKNPRKRFRRN